MAHLFSGPLHGLSHATSNSSTEPTRIEIFHELAAELQTHRSGVHGDKMAQNLLRFAKERDLLAVGPDARRAMYYELASRSVVAVQFDKHGVYRGQQELLQRELDDPVHGSKLDAENLSGSTLDILRILQIRCE